MFCGNCGTQLSEDSKFCGKCGAPIAPAAENESAAETATATVEMPVAAPVQQGTEQEKEKAASSALTWGILSLAFALNGIIVSFLGIIFGSKAFKKADYFTYLNNGVLEGKAKVGRILGKIGFIAGIVLTVFWVLYFFIIVIILGGLSNAGAFSGDWYL